MLTRVRNDYEKQQKMMYFRLLLGHKQKIGSWYMTARGNMDVHVSHRTVANRNIG